MIAPKMPTRFPERQAIVNDEAKGKFDHGIGVIGFRWSNVGCVDGEVFFALATIMFGIVQNGFDGTTGRRISKVMELSVAKCVSSAGVIAVRAPAFFAGTGTLFVRRFGQVCGIDNTFGGVGNILTRAGHSGFFHE